MRFHLAITVQDITAAKHFYSQVLNAVPGREDGTWVDLNLEGNQLSLHLVPYEHTTSASASNHVDNMDVPLPHFGIIVDKETFDAIYTKACSFGVNFIFKPTLRFEGKKGAQWTMFFQDPSGNCIEIKSFLDEKEIFDAWTEQE